MMGRPGDGRKERYLLNYLGSIESSLYKGNVVLCQAVRKIVSSQQKPNPHPTVLEISDKGIKIVDKSKFNVSTTPCHDYFYSLKNVTFCGFHPRDHRYFGFITKVNNFNPITKKGWAKKIFFSKLILHKLI